jgi:hypothetical protein
MVASAATAHVAAAATAAHVATAATDTATTAEAADMAAAHMPAEVRTAEMGGSDASAADVSRSGRPAEMMARASDSPAVAADAADMRCTSAMLITNPAGVGNRTDMSAMAGMSAHRAPDVVPTNGLRNPVPTTNGRTFVPVPVPVVRPISPLMVPRASAVVIGPVGAENKVYDWHIDDIHIVGQVHVIAIIEVVEVI